MTWSALYTLYDLCSWRNYLSQRSWTGWAAYGKCPRSMCKLDLQCAIFAELMSKNNTRQKLAVNLIKHGIKAIQQAAAYINLRSFTVHSEIRTFTTHIGILISKLRNNSYVFPNHRNWNNLIPTNRSSN